MCLRWQMIKRRLNKAYMQDAIAKKIVKKIIDIDLM